MHQLGRATLYLSRVRLLALVSRVFSIRQNRPLTRLGDHETDGRELPLWNFSSARHFPTFRHAFRAAYFLSSAIIRGVRATGWFINPRVCMYCRRRLAAVQTRSRGRRKRIVTTCHFELWRSWPRGVSEQRRETEGVIRPEREFPRSVYSSADVLISSQMRSFRIANRPKCLRVIGSTRTRGGGCVEFRGAQIVPKQIDK